MLLGGVVRGSPNPLHFGLAVRFRQAFRLSGLTRRALARHSDVSDPLIGYLETGRRLPTVATIVRVASGLSVSPGWLAYGIGEKSHEGPTATSDGMGARLLLVRTEMGLAKAVLARLVNLSPSALAKIENGGQTGIEVIEALARVLNVSPAWLAFSQEPRALASRRRPRITEASATSLD